MEAGGWAFVAASASCGCRPPGGTRNMAVEGLPGEGGGVGVWPPPTASARRKTS